ncbi:MAG TPA: metal ABC transporter ATP-binding protein [Candidatus Dormibacteraeota bacterium]|jgi:zinc/manganese transport system ATP-binding protein|nr:metal ABC transporter ATP-binding protein [Candidatus Dormibacteraeota bacterium]
MRPVAEVATDAVRFEDAGVRLGGRFVWRNIDLAVRTGEFVAILGPNGAGKSTLLKALLGVLPLTEGSVAVFGRPVRRGNDEVGYLPQRRSFDADLRIRALDLVRLGLDGARWGVSLPFIDRLRAGGGARAARVREVIRLVGAEAYAHRPIGELSGGEQQRILIAQALVSGARMLVLDEPLDSLDLNNQRAISGLVQRICHEQDVTVLLVAHDVNPIMPFLDRVVYVAQGQAVSGRPEEVINTETLTRLYGVPVDVLRTTDGRLVVVGQQEPVSYHAHHHDH